MGEFCEKLKRENIDPDEFIAYLRQSLAQDRTLEELSREVVSYKDHLERKHLLDMMELFLTKLERERIRQKTKELD
jgi:hypothetical protein